MHIYTHKYLARFGLRNWMNGEAKSGLRKDKLVMVEKESHGVDVESTCWEESSLKRYNPV